MPPRLNQVLLRDVPCTPWRNGQGGTQVLLEWPTALDWQCRISVAQIDRDGDFSAYPGVQRWFTVLRGAGVCLHFGTRLHKLKPGSAPLQFEGAMAPGCTLIEGPTQDLNLMGRQAAGHTHMQAADPQPWHSSAALRACFTDTAATLHVEGDAPLALPAQCLVWSAQDSAQNSGSTWALHSASGPLQAWWMSFEPTPPPSSP